MGDLLQSIGVLIAGILMWLRPSWWWADPVTTLMFSVIVFWTTRPLIKDITGILMQRAPLNIDTHTLEEQMHLLRDVESVTRLSVWSLSSDYHVMSAHVQIGDGVRRDVAIQSINKLCREHGIRDTTIQID